MSSNMTLVTKVISNIRIKDNTVTFILLFYEATFEEKNPSLNI